MMITLNSRARKGRKQRREVKGQYIYGRIWAQEEEGNTDYRGMVQPSQQHVVPCIKGVEWSLGMRGLKIVATFWGSGEPNGSSMHEKRSDKEYVGDKDSFLFLNPAGTSKGLKDIDTGWNTDDYTDKKYTTERDFPAMSWKISQWHVEVPGDVSFRWVTFP